MRSIIHGLPPRSGARIFQSRTLVRTCHEPADFFWRRSPTEHGTTARDFAAAVMFPDLPSGFGGVGFVRLIRLVSDVRSGRGGRIFNRVSLLGCCCLICAENGERPPNSGGEFRRALLPRGGVLGLVVGWWDFAAGGVGAQVEGGERLGQFSVST